MGWTIELLDASNGAALGEITGAKERSFNKNLLGARTVGFSVHGFHDAAQELLEMNRLLRVKRDGVLFAVNPCVAAEEVTEEGGMKIGVSSVDPFFDLLPWRMIGKELDATGKGVGISFGTALAPVVKGQIAKLMIDATNAENFTGIATNAAWITDVHTGFAGPFFFKPIAEAIQELAATLDGFDFDVAPVEPVAIAAGLKIAEFKTYAALGTTKPDVIFEYGDGKRNVVGYQRPRTREAQINKGWTLPAGFPDAAAAITPPNPDGTGGTFQKPLASTHDAAASIAAWKLREAVVSTDLAVDDMRTAIANEHVRIRKNPREQITFTLKSDIEYGFGSDFDVGDVVAGRAKVNDSVRFDAMFRIYGMNFTLSDEGVESAQPTLIPS